MPESSGIIVITMAGSGSILIKMQSEIFCYKDPLGRLDYMTARSGAIIFQTAGCGRIYSNIAGCQECIINKMTSTTVGVSHDCLTMTLEWVSHLSRLAYMLQCDLVQYTTPNSILWGDS